MPNLVTEQKQQQKMSLPTAGETEASNGTYFLTKNGNSTWKFSPVLSWVRFLCTLAIISLAISVVIIKLK
jgi:hypothetical protein